MNRREFLTATAKILAATATFGMLPDFAEAARKDKNKNAKEADKVQKYELPPLESLIKFEDLGIGKVNLEFKEMDVRDYTGAVVIHHAGLRKDVDIDVPAIHDMHLGNDWSGIGYHFVVHKDGFIEQGRPLEYVGAHALGNNLYTVGICLTGNYSLNLPPREQVLAAEQLTAALCQKYNFEPSNTTIFGHRELCATDCPGNKFFPYLPEFIKNVAQVF